MDLVVNCRTGAAVYTDDPAAAVAELDADADRVADEAFAAQLAEQAAAGRQADALAELRALAESGGTVDAGLLLRVLGPRLG